MNNKEVTILILTCNRIDGLKRILNSIEEKTKDISYELLVVADNNDTVAYEYCIEKGINCILTSWRRDFVANMNMAAYTCYTPYFVILADDMSIQQNNWLGDALKTYKESFSDNNGLMSFNDGIQNGKIFTCGMSSKRFVYQMGGHLYNPSFIHFGGDNVSSFIAKNINLYHYAKDVVVIHHHPTNKNVELANNIDETYKNSFGSCHQDQVLKKEMKKDINKLILNRNYNDFFEEE